MTFDVCILAGGKGTRLQRVWGLPKCLVPVAGKTVIMRLLEQVAPLRPRHTVLALGVGAWYVQEALRVNGAQALFPPGYLSFSIHPPHGTVYAVLRAIEQYELQPPLLVLNGDTLPGYELSDLLYMCNGGFGSGVVAWCGDQHAGAAVLNRSFLYELSLTKIEDLSVMLSALPRYLVASFLDVGTPDAFAIAQAMTRFP